MNTLTETHEYLEGLDGFESAEYNPITQQYQDIISASANTVTRTIHTGKIILNTDNSITDRLRASKGIIKPNMMAEIKSVYGDSLEIVVVGMFGSNDREVIKIKDFEKHEQKMENRGNCISQVFISEEVLKQILPEENKLTN